MFTTATSIIASVLSHLWQNKLMHIFQANSDRITNSFIAGGLDAFVAVSTKTSDPPLPGNIPDVS